MAVSLTKGPFPGLHQHSRRDHEIAFCGSQGPFWLPLVHQNAFFGQGLIPVSRNRPAASVCPPVQAARPQPAPHGGYYTLPTIWAMRAMCSRILTLLRLSTDSLPPRSSSDEVVAACTTPRSAGQKEPSPPSKLLEVLSNLRRTMKQTYTRTPTEALRPIDR